MRPWRAILVTTTLCLFAAQTLHAVPYTWQSKNGEAGFELDVPEAWRLRESVKRNGVITQFRRRDARIEVRSFVGKDKSEFSAIVNQKAARLASEFTFVRLVDERNSKYREDLHLSVWEFKSKGKLYRDETGIVLADAGPVVVSCVVPAEKYAELRTHCDNAFYSLSTGGSAPAASSQSKADALADWARIYYVNMPGNLPVLAPEAVMGTQPAKAEPAKINYDENYILPDENNK
ncbi:hypothetical protein [Turneriella parva]|uniref:Uncharacterized protein n=1 Tax=Turneriella parva (strain ATCC BAA-1111 / DSM 21527 / NCTC 11395 / H) TaxID=869212 RepID=I4B7W7_TURPD|nr:hypothetical protein [Turneriella parva]AFM13374.1 hypothetical protein Turpa_2735 [Turneriella parva DSM 21527]